MKTKLRKPEASGYPWFKIKAGTTEYHLRIPCISTASALAAYYSGVVIATQGAANEARKATEDLSGDQAVARAQAASEQVLKAQVEMYGALGFVLLSCWRDPEHEMFARQAWLSSYAIRKAIRDSLPLDGFDLHLVDQVREAQELMAEHQTDLKTAFGLLAWDEMVESGLTHESVQTIATECSRLVFESIKSKEGSGVEIIADF